MSVSARKEQDVSIPLCERAFLQWEDINFFVPTDSDPMSNHNLQTSQIKDLEPTSENNFNSTATDGAY